MWWNIEGTQKKELKMWFFLGDDWNKFNIRNLTWWLKNWSSMTYLIYYKSNDLTVKRPFTWIEIIWNHFNLQLNWPCLCVKKGTKDYQEIACQSIICQLYVYQNAVLVYAKIIIVDIFISPYHHLTTTGWMLWKKYKIH